ncbi:hydrogenase, group IIIb [Methylacidimicrobium cyclopophantes]|uniref:Hydrogenase, group IIIb n=1 Tax=Methylacidimicrobium cyclopophantes TaxID=1041766 RepID=A0A5E6MCG6_9BACT|nr:nickel-dependent hydrogenase large subunit [Methylacidimicrobium cyclopophantes]VVM06909.1 hydrogenase, group IIIb [Methylacidimicrobium cyclopophantes]
MPTKKLSLGQLARVEGEGTLELALRDGRVETARLRIFEPPRFFEALLRGRAFSEVPDIVARICGICPVAYQMSSVHALERALGLSVGGELRLLRRLLYCGEWIESHVLHIVMLHAPDFLGYADAVAMARDHGSEVRRGLALKRTGNEILRLLGGREIHPVNVKVGGFYRLPTRAELDALRELLEGARREAVALLRWVARFPMPDYERDYEFVALRHPSEYPMNEGRIVSSSGLSLSPEEFDAEFEERQLPHSTALYCALRRRGSYLVGPLARYNLNFDRLPPYVQSLAEEAGLRSACRNPFQSIVVRAVEVVFACEEAFHLLAAYEPPEGPSIPLSPSPGEGHACTEAPRGMLYHSYRLDRDGTIEKARIVPPTSQNQASIEEDLRLLAESLLGEPEEILCGRCEQAIRNYDPCISCSTHFLRLAIRRS